jgi:hypothetical protein
MIKNRKQGFELAMLQPTNRMTAMSAAMCSEYRASPLRVLVPINANENSRWGVRYAVQRHLEGTAIEVVLLNVGELITQWQVLRFRTQQEIAQFQSARAQAFIDEASQLLSVENIPYSAVFRQGDVVFSILDVAEELDCNEIALPQPKQRVANLFSRKTVTEVQQRQRGIPVVIVDCDGKLS